MLLAAVNASSCVSKSYREVAHVRTTHKLLTPMARVFLVSWTARRMD
jgi:hypothetical protein